MRSFIRKSIPLLCLDQAEGLPIPFTWSSGCRNASTLQQWTSALFCNSPSTKLRETCSLQLAKLHRGSITFLFLYSAMSTVTAISFKPKATRKMLKKEILSDDFKKRKIFWKNIAENFMENFPPHITIYGVF
jgi:hypothetical protein